MERPRSFLVYINIERGLEGERPAKASGRSFGRCPGSEFSPQHQNGITNGGAILFLSVLC